MKLSVPTIRSNMYGFSEIAHLAELSKNLWFDDVILSFDHCGFFEANMSAPLSVVIANLRSRVNDVDIQGVSTKIGNILKKNHFLSTFNMEALHDTNQTTLPFKKFKLGAGEQFNEYLEQYMRGRGIPTMSVSLSKRFRQSLLEIFLNASIHSGSEFGIVVCGQYFPNKNRLDFTIVDAGIGIRENVRRYTGNQQISSCAAIEWALTEGNTTQTGPQPGGLGLKLLMDFIRLNRGKLQIVSRFGYYEFQADGGSFSKMAHDFTGTCVNIEINTRDPASYCLRSELTNEDIF